MSQGREQFGCHNGCRMCLEQRAVFLPRLAGILAECLLYGKEQFRRFIKRVIGPIDPQQEDEKQEGADS